MDEKLKVILDSFVEPIKNAKTVPEYMTAKRDMLVKILEEFDPESVKYAKQYWPEGCEVDCSEIPEEDLIEVRDRLIRAITDHPEKMEIVDADVCPFCEAFYCGHCPYAKLQGEGCSVGSNWYKLEGAINALSDEPEERE